MLESAAMIEWTEEQHAFQAALRRFIEAEIAPNLEELEHGDTPPYDVLRKLFDTFGIAEMQRARLRSVLKKSPEQDGTPREGGGYH